MVPEDLARQALTVDAAFCVAVGAAAPLMARKVASRLTVPVPLIVGAGLASVGWGAWVAGLSGGTDWRRATRMVAAGNAAGAVGLTVLSTTRPGATAWVGPAVLAGQVAAFGAVQVAALLWDRKAHIGTDPQPSPPHGDPASSEPRRPSPPEGDPAPGPDAQQR